MTLPDHLLLAILRATDDAAERDRLARRWECARRRSEFLAERIREQMRHVRCSCFEPANLDDRGRCSRCWGWPASVGDARDAGDGG